MSSTGRLFDPDPFDARPTGAGSSPGEPGGASAGDGASSALDAGAIPVRIRPEVSGLDKEFDYAVPDALVDQVDVGSIVRIELNGRNVAGWVTAVGSVPPAGVELRPIGRVSSVGPTADIVDLARWAARRWSGRLAAILRTASPPRLVRSLPPPVERPPTDPTVDQIGELVQPGPQVIRVAPTDDLVPLVAELAAGGDTIVVAPRVGQAAALAGGLRRHGLPTRLHPRDWAAAAGRGGVVLGARSAVWARVPDLAAIVVVDEHDEALQEERNPTWHARDIAIERAARAGVPCFLISPAPSLAGLEAAGSRRSYPPRSAERAGWPVVEIVDRRGEEPGRSGLFSPRVADLVRSPGVVVAVLNRKGRAIVLACTLCGELVRTEDGEHLMVERDGVLVAPSTGEQRPIVCAHCGSTSLKRLRLGVTRAAEELAALAGEPVTELAAGGAKPDPAEPPSRIVVGTEAALHQIGRADSVVFLDFDQELLAPRYRAAEQAMSLLVLAARLAGPRASGGRVLVQTRTPDHRVLRAAVRADPGLLAEAERTVRKGLGWPPFGALAELGGAAAGELAASLRLRSELAVLGPRDDDRYLVRAATADELATALATVERPIGRHRVAVDPPRA